MVMRDGVRGTVEERTEAGEAVRQKIYGPKVGFEVRRVIDGLAFIIVPPAVLLEVRDVDPVAPEAQPSRRAEVGEDALGEGLVPAVRLEAGGRQERSQHRARVVVAVVGHEPERRGRAPGDMTKGADAAGRRAVPCRGRIRNRRNRAAVGRSPPLGDRGFIRRIQGEEHRRLALAVIADRQALELGPVGLDARGEALEHAERAVARRLPRGGRGEAPFPGSS